MIDLISSRKLPEYVPDDTRY